MKLYVFPYAPNPTKVRLYLAEKRAAGSDLDVDEIIVDLIEGEQKKPAHLARNPFGVLPVLELPSGEHLIESLAIIELFEDLHPEPSLYGADPEARAIGRQIERIADLGILLPIGGIVHATNSPLGRAPDPAVANHYRDKLPPKLEYLESLLKDGRPFLAGASPSVADCTLAAALQFGRFRDLDFIAGYSGLQRWDKAYREREPGASILLV
jgi:glutathione S-transferase